MTPAGWVLGTFMVLCALAKIIAETPPRPRRRTGGLGYNRKARR